MDPGGSRSRPALHAVFTEVADVGVVLLGIDSRFWPVVEPVARYAVTAAKEVREPAGSGLPEITNALHVARPGWVLSGAYSTRRGDGELAEQSYLGAVRDLVDRAIRTPRTPEPHFAGGVYRDGAPSSHGLFLAIVVAAARERIADVDRAGDARQIDATLRGLGALSGERLAELVLAPLPGETPLSFDEARRLFPELKPVDPATMERRGRCRRCDAPVIVALGACTLCDAPVAPDQ